MLENKVQKIPKVQLEDFQDLIVDPNITYKSFFFLILHFMTIIFLNYLMFVQILFILKKFENYT
jgi:hypothetical protein